MTQHDRRKETDVHSYRTLFGIIVILCYFSARSACIMTAQASAPVLTVSRPCFHHSPLVRSKVHCRGAVNSRCGCCSQMQRHRSSPTCARALKGASEVSNSSHSAEPGLPEYGSTAPPKPAASPNLLQVLAEAAVKQGLRQVQSTVDQLQQAGNKLTKGFSARPPGYPPGTTLPLDCSFMHQRYITHPIHVLNLQHSLCAYRLL